MRFEWDEDKRRANTVKHGIDFIKAQEVFDGRPVYEYPSLFVHEMRNVTIAAFGTRLIAVVWTMRGDGIIRIISARGARNGEKRKYRDLYG